MTVISAIKITLTTLGAGLLAGMVQAATVNIGFTGPLSGGAALYGQDAVNGMQMAAREINDAGGFQVDGKTHRLKIVTLDDKYAPSQAAVNAKRLVRRERTPLIFTPHSGGVHALQAFNERDGFLLMAYTSVPTVTQKGNSLTVRIPPTFTGYLQPFTRLAMEHYGKKLAIATASHDYAKMWIKAFIPAWEGAGGQIVANNPLDYNKSADFYTGVSRVLAEKPDVLFIGGASEPTGLVVRQARELGFKGGIILLDQAKMNDVAAVSGGLTSLEGAIGVLPLDEYGTPTADDFVTRYRAHYGSTPPSEASYHYFAVHLAAQAMQEAGTVSDPRAIRAALPSALQTISVTYNPYDIRGIDDGGGLIFDPRIGIVQDGQIKRLRLSEVMAEDETATQ